MYPLAGYTIYALITIAPIYSGRQFRYISSGGLTSFWGGVGYIMCMYSI